MTQAFNVVCEVAASYGPTLVSGGAILIGAIIAACMANNTIKTQRDIARKSATMDLIRATEEQDYYSTILSAYQEMKERNDKGLTALHDGHVKDRNHVLAFLSHHELIAVGIKEEILDERMYREWMETPYVTVWEEAKIYILKRQEENTKAYVNFKDLAERWIKERDNNSRKQNKSL